MRKPMTDKAFAKIRRQRQEQIFEVVNALHDKKFSNILIESNAVGKEDYFTRILINRETLDWDEFSMLSEVAYTFDAKLHLRNDYNIGSRLALWLPKA